MFKPPLQVRHDASHSWQMREPFAYLLLGHAATQTEESEKAAGAQVRQLATFGPLHVPHRGLQAAQSLEAVLKNCVDVHGGEQ